MRAPLRTRVKEALPYWLTCAIARALNPTFLADIHRCERLDEYAWVLKHVQGPRIVDVGYAGSYFAQMLTEWGQVTGVDPRDAPHIPCPRFHREWPWIGTGYDTAVCVSVLEHLSREDAYALVERMYVRSKQVLITVPYGSGRFMGYQPFTDEELARFPGRLEVELVDYGGQNSTHQVAQVAFVRLTHPADPSLGVELDGRLLRSYAE